MKHIHTYKIFESKSKVDELQPLFIDCIDELEDMGVTIPKDTDFTDDGMGWWSIVSNSPWEDSYFIIGSIPNSKTRNIILNYLNSKKEQIESQIYPTTIEINSEQNSSGTFWVDMVIN